MAERAALLIGRALDAYSTCTEKPSELFRESFFAESEEWSEELARDVQRLESEEAGALWLMNGGEVRKRHASKSLVGEGQDDRIIKYERHLHSLLIPGSQHRHHRHYRLIETPALETLSTFLATFKYSPWKPFPALASGRCGSVLA